MPKHPFQPVQTGVCIIRLLTGVQLMRAMSDENLTVSGMPRAIKRVLLNSCMVSEISGGARSGFGRLIRAVYGHGSQTGHFP